jgi:hypothetical protein
VHVKTKYNNKTKKQKNKQNLEEKKTDIFNALPEKYQDKMSHAFVFFSYTTCRLVSIYSRSSKFLCLPERIKKEILLGVCVYLLKKRRRVSSTTTENNKYINREHKK